MKNNQSTKIGRHYSVIFLFVYLIALFIFAFTTWMTRTFGDVEFEQYLFGITAPTSGTPSSFYIQIAKYLGAVLVTTLVLTFITVIVLNHVLKYWQTKRHIKMRINVITLLISLVSLSASGTYMNEQLKISHYFTTPQSAFIETHYVEPRSENIQFPTQKKNLIYIYLESYEGTYWSKELGGNVDANLIPGLTHLLEDSNAVNFSDKEQFGGGYQAPSTGYSIAGMFAQQSGLPFKVPMDGNEYGNIGAFVPGAITLGDILQYEGYNLKMVVGADGVFAGVTIFYETHGNFDVLDLISAKERGKLPEDYNVWWGFEDSKLFNFGKEFLVELSQKEQPFALILEADDTHFPDGYTDSSCPTTSDKPYENSISCVDQMVTDFVNYVKTQDYYKDTVIVIHGDHLSMEKNYFGTLDANYRRNTFNAYINISDELIANATTKNRRFNSMDVFPTILEAMDVNVENHRLGIGTSLFSNRSTYYEEIGVEEVNQSLEGPSSWFTNQFLKSERKYK